MWWDCHDDISICFQKIIICSGQKGHERRVEIVVLLLFLIQGCRQKTVFLGQRGPLVLPLVDSSGALKVWITYIQAYLPYESSAISSNQPDGPMGSHRCPWPLESRINSRTFLGQFVLVAVRLIVRVDPPTLRSAFLDFLCSLMSFWVVFYGTNFHDKTVNLCLKHVNISWKLLL